MVKWALRLTRSPQHAEDLVQETYLKVLLYGHSYKEGTNLEGWLRTIVTRQFLNLCAANKRNEMLASRLAETRDFTSLEIDIESPVHGAMALVSPKHAATLRAVYLEDKDPKDAACELGIPVATVSTRLFKAHRQIRRAYAEGVL